MIRNIKFQIFLMVGILIFTAINCNESIVEPQTNGNLLPNGSFESNNKPSLDGWRYGNQQLAELINQAAPNGGNWSVQLTSDWAPTSGYVYTPISNVKSGDIVTLSAFVRCTGSFGGRGIIKLVVGQNIINYRHSKSISNIDTAWTQISLTDTLTLTPSDTLWVILSSPITEIVQYQQMFDLVKLEKISN